jgi:hypothetical protein
MAKDERDNLIYRGLLQSDDGIIAKVVKANSRVITFQTTFGLNDQLIERLKNQSEHIVFSERSRIARLGVQIKCEPPSADALDGDRVTLTLVASPVIPGYPGLNALRDFFTLGLPVGRLVFCDPAALLTSDEVLEANERSQLKLPESTTISADGSIVIAPHKVICELKQPLDKETLGRILLREDGRELLNRYQVRKAVRAVNIAPGKGAVTTCSMYLNEHYVVLQSGFELGRNLPATVLDPIKTRGIRIYLEIVNQTGHPIVNPLIAAKVYYAAKSKNSMQLKKKAGFGAFFTYKQMRQLEKKFDPPKPASCHHLDKPVAVIDKKTDAIQNARIYLNGPDNACEATRALCAVARRDFSPASECSHEYATSKLSEAVKNSSAVLAMKYFPNLMEHRDIINLACDGKIKALYFYEPSCEHGPFLFKQLSDGAHHAGWNGLFCAAGAAGRFPQIDAFRVLRFKYAAFEKGRITSGTTAGRPDRVLGPKHRHCHRRRQRCYGTGQYAGSNARHFVRCEFSGHYRSIHDHRCRFLPGFSSHLPS